MVKLDKIFSGIREKFNENKYVSPKNILVNSSIIGTDNYKRISPENKLVNSDLKY